MRLTSHHTGTVPGGQAEDCRALNVLSGRRRSRTYETIGLERCAMRLPQNKLMLSPNIRTMFKRSKSGVFLSIPSEPRIDMLEKAMSRSRGSKSGIC